MFLQIEVDRSLYMNEETFERAPSFGGLQWDMSRLIGMLVHELPQLDRRLSDGG